MRDHRPVSLVLAGALVAGVAWLVAGPGPSGGPHLERSPDAPGSASPGASVAARAGEIAGPSGRTNDVERTEVAPAEREPDPDPDGFVLVRGRVVDDLGNPVAGAQVSVTTVRTIPIAFGEMSWSSAVMDLGDGSMPNGSFMISFERDTVFTSRLIEGTPQPTFETRIGQTTGASQPRGIELHVVPRIEQLSSFRADGTSATSSVITTFDPRPELEASTESDGTFEIRGKDVEVPFTVSASAGGHTGDSTQPAAIGAEVLLTLRRAAWLESSLLLPDWLPPSAVGMTLRPTGGGNDVEARIVGLCLATGWIEPGIYDLAVHVRGVPEAVLRIPDVSLVVGDRQPDPRVDTIDLTHALFRYRVRAVDATGALLDDLPSPLLARVGDGEEAVWTAFPWQGGRTEFFAPDASIDTIGLAAGYRRQDRTLYAGDSDIVFTPLQPVEVVLPGLRALCGPARKVRISMVLQGSTGMPTSIQATDPRSGNSKGFSRWHLGMSGGAWLGATDTVFVPLVLDGRYDVIVRLHEEGVPGDVSITCLQSDIALDSFVQPRLAVPLDAEQIRAAVEGLRARAQR